MALNDCVQASELQAGYFPQPSRPNNSYQNSWESSIPDYNGLHFLEEEEQEEEASDIYDYDTLRILRGVFGEIDEREFESLKKVFSKVGNKFPFKRFIIDTLQDYEGSGSTLSDLVENLRGKLRQGESSIDSTYTTTDRGVHLDMRSIGELDSKPKMERFKVKTVKLGGGVVKQEQK